MSDNMDVQRSRLFISGALIILLGIIITVFSIVHTIHMGGSFFEYPLFLYGTAIVSLALGGFLVYSLEEKVNKGQVNKLLSILPNDARKVMRILLERKEIEQKKLKTLSGLSTVKVSRVVSVLEQRGVIEKKKQGYTNLILLKL